MAEFRRKASKIAEETVYSSNNENDGYLSESDDGDGDKRDERFPEENVKRFTTGSPANFLKDLSENTSVLEHTKQRLNSELNSTTAQLPSKKTIKRMIDKKRSHESDESDSVSAGKKQKKEGKKQEKLLRSQDLQTDLVDIISNNERYRRKLMFTNSKNASNAEVYECVIKELKKRCAERNEQFLHNVTQTRNKFEKLMSICKAALLTQKTASGIKRFQDQKEYGQWFDENKSVMPARTGN